MKYKFQTQFLSIIISLSSAEKTKGYIAGSMKFVDRRPFILKSFTPFCLVELEQESPIINWSTEVADSMGSRLFALWNRTAGDCLLDSVLQATWGVFDTDSVLRRALGDSLNEGAHRYASLDRSHFPSMDRDRNLFYVWYTVYRAQHIQALRKHGHPKYQSAPPPPIFNIFTDFLCIQIVIFF